jgi:hypothetical protein
MNYNKEETSTNNDSIGEKHQKHSKNRLLKEEKQWISQLPILRGFSLGGSVYVHCPWCDRMHVHGWESNDSSRVITLRVAHGGHEPPAPPSYRVGVFGEKDLQRIADRAVRNLVVGCG